MRNLLFILLFTIISLLAADNITAPDPHKLPDGFYIVDTPLADKEAAPATEEYDPISDKKEMANDIQQCRLGQASACYDAGHNLTFASDYTHDYFQALKYLERGCILKHHDACADLAIMYSEGYGVKQDYFKAFEINTKACKLKSSMGCYNLAVLYFNGDGIRQNRPKAKDLYGKSCDMKYQEGCEAYAKMNQKGVK